MQLKESTKYQMEWRSSLVYAIDPNASAALQNAKKQDAAKAQNMQERITRMEDQIARMNEELIALREQKIQDQRELQAKK